MNRALKPGTPFDIYKLFINVDKINGLFKYHSIKGA